MTLWNSLLGIVIGITLIVAIGTAGSSGMWDRFSLPPMVICVSGALIVQWISFYFAWRKHSERFFDLIGSMTFVMVIAIALGGSRNNLGWLDLACSAAVILWALRLGTFLYLRIRSIGEDKRFEVMKWQMPWFLMTWTLQAAWVVVTSGAVLSVVADGRAQQIGPIEGLGLSVWLVGFLIEIVADEQKKRFRLTKPFEASFVSTGLWGRARHPNYFGEILLWSGLAITVFPSLAGWQLATLGSPVFVWLLLTQISGIPILEAAANKRWGQNPQYLAYRKRTPRLFPRIW